ncbi:hypothetical protein [Lichenifustis flavocetrariae]|uniref:Uncharacterized protein n=1 Tax=Lichenifustis flavocetrariae TaxID=2949735 RepID=A0AA41YSG2_9HYPH|nr:hypothetical protein [Lichenifustis flavocetrariae]MCW6507739.1 hypothetical protein [Lichenifustis flavocetrariae]
MKLRSGFFGIVGSGVTVVVLKVLYEGALAIYGAYASKFFDDKLTPYVTDHVWPRARPMVEWLNNFWGGAAIALIVALILERLWAWRYPLAKDEKPVPGRAELIELGRECVVMADETLRTQQQIEDAAPRPPRPEGGYKDQDHWSRVQFNHSLEAHEYHRRAIMQRDRAHGADLMDAIFRLRDLGLTIPVFADDVPGATDEVRGMLLPHYLSGYARFVGTMGRILKRGDLEAARRSSRDWRPVTEQGATARP